MSINEKMNNLEAILFASGEPVEITRLEEGMEMPKTDVIKLVNNLKDRYEDTALELIELGTAYQIVTKARYGKIIKDVIEATKNTPLSQAALEVLSIIAYNSPVTRSFVEQARGVDSSGVIYNLIDRGLLEEAGRLDLPGKPISYKTTANFLRSFSLTSLLELPSLKKEEATLEKTNILEDK